METLVDVMDFGGHVSYTTDGFECWPFGTAVVKEIIASAKTQLDIPSVFALHPGRRGFSRRRLAAPGGQVIVYSAFIGLAEPEVRRLGSFLAVGVAAKQELDGESIGLGHRLSRLLADLTLRVSDGSRFVAPLQPEMLNRFLGSSFDLFDDIHTKIRLLERDPHYGQIEERTVFLAGTDNELADRFDQICAATAPGAELYVFASGARPELQSAQHDFRLLSWPLPAAKAGGATPHRPLSSAGAGHARDAEEASRYTGKTRQTSAAISADTASERRNATSSEHLLCRLESMEKRLASTRRLATVAACAISAVLLLTLASASYWHSAAAHEINELHQRIETLRSESAQTRASQITEYAKTDAGEDAARTAGSAQPQQRSLRREVIQRRMNLNEIRNAECPEHPASSREFKREFEQLNPQVLDDRGLVGNNTEVVLPAGC